MGERDFYDFTYDGGRLRLPRVTSILRIIDRSNALMGWATRIERDAFKATLEDALTEPGELTVQRVWDRMMIHLSGKRAHVKARDEAANIGRSAHDIIKWHTRKLLGLAEDGPEPSGPDASMRAVFAWFDWCKAVDFVPLYAEHFVFCPWCGYAGTTDAVGKVEGRILCIDYKTGKAVYHEAHLQVRAYRHALAREGIHTEGGIVLRLPKTEADPAFEAVAAIEIPYGYWISASRLWRWQQIMDGDDPGPELQKCEVKE